MLDAQGTHGRSSDPLELGWQMGCNLGSGKQGSFAGTASAPNHWALQCHNLVLLSPKLHFYKSPKAVVRTCNLSSGAGETDRSCNSLAKQPSQMAKSLVREWLLKNQDRELLRDEIWGEPLTSPYMCIHVCPHITCEHTCSHMPVHTHTSQIGQRKERFHQLCEVLPI